MRKYYTALKVSGSDERYYVVIEARSQEDAFYKAIDKYGVRNIGNIMTEYKFVRSPLKVMGFIEYKEG